jgi:ATP-dependent exoDNAse (exonuclease V) beta subunit
MAELLQFRGTLLHDEPEDDQAARALALDVRQSFIVEAPAGSGKTGLLVQRFLKLLGDADTEQPEEVLAMTFTRKATAEMAERVLQQLQRAASQEPLPESAKAFERDTRMLAEAVLARSESCGWNLLEQPQRLNIRSILSVCTHLAAARPILTGSGGQQTPLEDARPLHLLAAHRTFQQMGDRTALDDALRTVLLLRDGNLDQCERLLAEMLAAREQWAELVPLAPGELDEAALDNTVRRRLEQVLERISLAAIEALLTHFPTEPLHSLSRLAHEWSREPGYQDAPSPLLSFAEHGGAPSATIEDLPRWEALCHLLLTASNQWRSGFNANHIHFKLPRHGAEQLRALIDELRNHRDADALIDAIKQLRILPGTRYPEHQWVNARALFHVLRRALAELTLVFVERGECDFNEIALAAQAALDDTGDEESVRDLALSAGGRLRHLLVDEMQDTSNAQYELIKSLTQSWDGHSQTVFLVGDPKQSIYLFRQARVERFLRTMQEAHLGDLPLKPLRLTRNFRSQRHLVHDFNQIFGGTRFIEGIFPHPEHAALTRGEVPFVEALADRSTERNLGVQWHTAVLQEARATAQWEALQIRQLIEARLAEQLPNGREQPWRIAVLARSREHLLATIEALKGSDTQPLIPYRAVDLDRLVNTPEVLDVFALTRALLHPADRIAWLAVLRAPWCGLDRADLLALVGEGMQADDGATVAQLVAAQSHLLSDTGQRLLQRAWRVLLGSVQTLGREPLSIHVERTWRSLLGDAILRTEQQSNVRQFFTVLRTMEQEAKRIDFELLQERLTNLYAEPYSGPAQVELMTIHKAKGLEWDFVFLPGLHRRPRMNSSMLLNWLELEDESATHEASILLAPIGAVGGTTDPLTRWLRDVRQRRERAEEKRLFYVASTRAKEELHLFASLRRNQGSFAAPALGSLLKAAWPAANVAFLDLAATLEAEAQGRPDATMDEPLQLAAAADTATTPPSVTTDRVQRIPMDVDFHHRFAQAGPLATILSTATSTPAAPHFQRPEGSFAVRAFGNVVHRYLEHLAKQRSDGVDATTLLQAVATWQPRLRTSLRSEGLTPTDAAREAERVQRALLQILNDPIGAWILTPHREHASEHTMHLQQTGSLRVDRTFLAGETPLSIGDVCIWIVDFKTSEQGSYTDAVFERDALETYGEQMETYARLRRLLPGGELPIFLGLYYPLIPRLLWWRSNV